MKRPSIKTPCVADHYSDKRRERIAEVFDAETQLGCLIRVRRQDNGRLSLEVYRVDAGIDVLVSDKREGGAA